MKVPNATPDFRALDMSDYEIGVYRNIDGKLTVRELVGKSEMTEFEVCRARSSGRVSSSGRAKSTRSWVRTVQANRP